MAPGAFRAEYRAGSGPSDHELECCSLLCCMQYCNYGIRIIAANILEKPRNSWTIVLSIFDMAFRLRLFSLHKLLGISICPASHLDPRGLWFLPAVPTVFSCEGSATMYYGVPCKAGRPLHTPYR